MVTNCALQIAYDGAPFFGWQKTAKGPSIEAVLEEILAQLLQEQVVLQAASRTDRGVHAEGQWVNFLTDKTLNLEALKKSLNALLPPSIRVLSAHAMPLHFHPTLYAHGKEYHYHVCYAPLQ